MDKGHVILDTSLPIWDQFFSVAPLILIGSKEGDYYNLAPKHMSSPMSWSNYFGFVCTPKHQTYQNIVKNKTFTVSYPRPNHIVLSSLTATPRNKEDKLKSLINNLPTTSARLIDGVFLKDAYLQLECELYRIYDDFEENSLITGKVVGAYVDEYFINQMANDEQTELYHHPLLTYIHPGRFAVIMKTMAFPFPKDFKR
jgi:flavin reductase (DIM6/NTAB) family NADH-FMN oxidoreductase RutF